MTEDNSAEEAFDAVALPNDLKAVAEAEIGPCLSHSERAEAPPITGTECVEPASSESKS